jgi:hypothetical protein
MCTVTPSAAPGGSIDPSDPVQVECGGSQQFTAHPDVGFEVKNWHRNCNVVQVGGTTYTLSDIKNGDKVRVIFKQCKHKITPSAGPGGSIEPAEPVKVGCGGSQEFTAHPDAGFEVDNWHLDCNVVQVGGTTYTLSDIQANHSVRVIFKQCKHTITPSAGPGGSIEPADPVQVDCGSSQEFTADPDADFDVDTWYLDGDVVQTGGASYTLSDIQADHEVHVTFKLIRYTITPSAGPGGSINPDSPVIAEVGSKVIFMAQPDEGYELDLWYLDGGINQITGMSYLLSDIQDDHEVHVTFKKLLSDSLGAIDFASDEEFENRIANNNSVDPQDPDKTRIHVQRVTDPDPDLDGTMLMHCLIDLDPSSETYWQIINARAKGSFAPTDADEILITLKYLFTTSGPGVELIVYLSDVPELLDHDDPGREQHYLEVARIPAPPAGRPGSAESGEFAVFRKLVPTGHLDLTDATYVELELIEPESSNSVFIDSWDSAVQCYGICLDLNWDNYVDVADFLTVIGECGHAAVGDRACCEGVFSSDGVIDTFDVSSWDWALNADNRLLNYCMVPLVGEATAGTSGVGAFFATSNDAAASGETVINSNMAGTNSAGTSFIAFDSPPAPAETVISSLTDIVFLGKRATNDAVGKLQDRLYSFRKDGQYDQSLAPPSQRCNTRLVRDSAGQMYIVNSESGVLRLGEGNEVVVPPGAVGPSGGIEPRYGQPANVYVGIQNDGPDAFGRPILDVAFDTDYVYIVPVVVAPDSNAPYTAAAKLQLLDGGNPPYQIVSLYDDPPLPNDNQYRDRLREIEVDSAGNVYVLNVHALNESEILWRYKPDQTVDRFNLGRPDTDKYVPSPIAMHWSDTTDTLYLASARLDPAATGSVMLYGFSTNEALSLQRSITVTGMQHVTGITEDPVSGSLWVVGFNMRYVPEYPVPYQLPFYYPCMAEVAEGNDTGEAVSLFDPESHDLALPMSALWVGASSSCFPQDCPGHDDWVALGRPKCWCQPYQCDGDIDGQVETEWIGFWEREYRVYSNDFNALLDNWGKSSDDPTFDPCADVDHNAQGPAKYRVYSNDLAVLLSSWRKTDADLPGDCPRPE